MVKYIQALFILLIIFVFVNSITLLAMEHYSPGYGYHIDVWATLQYDEEKKCYDFDKSIIYGLEKSGFSGSFVALNTPTIYSKYLVSVEPFGAVAIVDNGAKKAETFSYQSDNAIVSHIGTSLLCGHDEIADGTIRYVVVGLKQKHADEKTKILLFKHYEDLSGPEIFCTNKLVFEQTFDQKINFYVTYTIYGRELIAFVFHDRVRLFDIEKGHEIATLISKHNKKITECHLSHKREYLMFRTCTQVMLIDLQNNDRTLFIVDCKRKIKTGITAWKYLALAFLNQVTGFSEDAGVSLEHGATEKSKTIGAKERQLIALFDIQKQKKESIVDCFRLGPKDTFGIYKGSQEYYFVTLGKKRKSIYVHNLHPGPCKKIFEKCFTKQIKSFDIRKGISCDRSMKIIFADGEMKPYALCLSKK